MDQKQNPIANGRPFASTNSSQMSGRTSFLPKKIDSPVSCVSPTIPKSTLNAGSRTKDNRQAIDTPVKAFLSSNITPRSSSRKARAESASSTPNGTPGETPSNSRPSSMIYSQDRDSEHQSDITGLGIRRQSTGHRARSSSISSDRQTTLSFRPPSRERELHSAKATGPGNNPKFFHADDIRPALASIPSERVIEQGIANGLAGFGGRDGIRTSRSVLGSSPPADEQRPKFFYANDVAESGLVSKPSTSRTAKAPYPIHTGTSPSTHSGPQQQRATSPLKEEIVSRKSSLSKPRRHTRLVSNPNVGLELDPRSPESMSISQSNISRRSSLKSPDPSQISHARSSSVGAVAPMSVRRGSVTWSEGPIVDSPQISPAAEPAYLQGTGQIASMLHENPPAPTAGKPTLGQSKLDHMNELAANARRERKVLDLEISNSSLLAINKTLEREMRKQSAELRRFRRRSQPGRLSTAPGFRSTSHTLSILSRNDQSEDESDEHSDRSSPSVFVDDDENFSDDTSERSPSTNTSQPLSAARASRPRDQDAKRIHQDLARHRELLIDSQKLNESIKRCLGRTGDLIADGKKALEYKAQISGVETRGGRVLLPDEVEDGEIGQHGQGLLSPGVTDKNGMEWDLGKDKNEDGEQSSAEIGDDSSSEPEKDDTVPSPDEQTAETKPDPSNKLSQEPITSLLPVALESPPPAPPSPSPPQPQPELESQSRLRLQLQSQPQPPLELHEQNRLPRPDDVQTPAETPPSTTVGSVQGIKEYLAIFGPAWGL